MEKVESHANGHFVFFRDSILKKKISSLPMLNIVTKMSAQIYQGARKKEKDEKINGTLNGNCCKAR